MSELFALFAGGAPGDGPVDDRSGVDAEVSARLSSPDRQTRMAAYAYLYASPDPARTTELVDAVTVESTRFGQFWAVRALRRQVQADPSALDAATRRRLEGLAATLDPETDGAEELRQLLRESLAESSDSVPGRDGHQ